VDELFWAFVRFLEKSHGIPWQFLYKALNSYDLKSLKFVLFFENYSRPFAEQAPCVLMPQTKGGPINMRNLALPPRLLTKQQAAAYCGVCVTTFINICPVPPLRFGDSVRAVRYDKQRIDAWIDGLDAVNNNNPDKAFWLSKLDSVDEKRVTS
jgi:hypothetical protein